MDQVDRVVYAAVAGTSTPNLDIGMRGLSTAANYSRLWFGIAGGLALVAGARGRRAALAGTAAIALTSAVVNLAVKTTVVRGRPDRAAAAVAASRHVRMPVSTSFPSGHSASAFAFATAVGDVLVPASAPLHALAAGVAYSRIHTGVHYPGDVVAGSMIGSVIGAAVGRLVRRFP
ncbi:undecaprenyl-diphosphatase [Allocatelliglobosispora scoriae]|uniref:Undecaprenyl-diphosphatase n=1 Tax=Allocatelliglobosispora scoriae TaxID=643052 RepID=A0A841BMN1_9ACTN|nr:phosphatase PAP2 family protein [Allocatelliglobosispora scoriae]MBB5868638.1 undecaprenyl-diphosphatase [Allocatelliglobosispora scoriae]